MWKFGRRENVTRSEAIAEPVKEIPTADGHVGKERVAKTIAIACLGKKCPNYAQEPCTTSYGDLLAAPGASGSTDLDLPPYIEEAPFALYGLVCTQGPKDTIVAIHTTVFKPEETDPAMILGIGSMYTSGPATISSADTGEMLGFQTFVSSEDA